MEKITREYFKNSRLKLRKRRNKNLLKKEEKKIFNIKGEDVAT